MSACLACAELAYKQAAQPVYVAPGAEPFTVLMAECDHEMEDLARALARTRNPLLWQDEFLKLLLHYHELSHLTGQAGRGLISLARSRAVQAVQSGAGSTAPEADYVQGFLRSLLDKDPRYWRDDGQLDADAVLNRMRMYQGRMRGTAGLGFVDPLTPATEIWWVLGGTEDHCLDCPYNASVSPWTKDTLYTTPGGGDTICLYNCRCHLATSDGRTSPKPVPRGQS